MNILLLGSGGRECALAWKLKQSKLLTQLYIAPGNGGTLDYGKNIDIKALDFDSIKNFCLERSIDMVVCGPEQPSVAGLWDFFQQEGLRHIPVISPSKIAAQLEGSKSFAKSFMSRHSIPTADYLEVDNTNIEKAYQWFDEKSPPYVIKADGLAEGKGVVLPETKEEAKILIDEFVLNRRFGESSDKVVLEEFLDGIEFSIFVYTNGKEYVMLPNAKDYKRRFEANIGLNTGGMGCVSPVPFVDEALLEEVKSRIIQPTVDGLKNENMPYQGFIYFGLIKGSKGIRVIEYNCRLGDPEAEVILPRMEGDIIELFLAGLRDDLSTYNPLIQDNATATVILVSKGYPESYEKGFKMIGIENVHQALIFHAGTALKNHELVTNGGRVLAVTGIGKDLKSALENSYDAISRIRFEGMQYRTDIGFEFV